jgi:pyrroline-5-carboxylate reductase
VKSILIIGCGNMGGAMLAGWLAGGMAPGIFTVVDPLLAEAPAGVKLLRALPEGNFDAVLLGVKPQLLGDVASDLAPLLTGDTILLSILAGAELASLAALFPQARAIVRIMPNLAAAVGKSPIAMAAHGLGEVQIAQITALMQPLGTPEWFDEAQFDAVTALAGSGPAFVYRFIDALAQGGAALGLPPEQAQRLALATVEGAGALASASPHSPGELARRVASPGGTTEAGLKVLDAEGAIARLVADTLEAAAVRSAEMARAARK